MLPLALCGADKSLNWLLAQKSLKYADLLHTQLSEPSYRALVKEINAGLAKLADHASRGARHRVPARH